MKEKIKELRLLRGLSQEELAKLAGFKSRSSINKIELGRCGKTGAPLNQAVSARI